MTVAGREFYDECLGILHRLDAASRKLSRPSHVKGEVKLGLMPTFTRRVLPPTLKSFMEFHPGVSVKVTEGYSAVLTELVRKGDLDCAVVPGFSGAAGLRTSLILRDQEVLVSRRMRENRHRELVNLSELAGLKIVVPGALNTRRLNLEAYFSTHGVKIERRLELDAMMGTLELVRTSDWVSILPSVIMGADFGGEDYEVRPLTDPALQSDFVLIEPARRTMSVAASLFVDLLRDEAHRAVGLKGDDLAQIA